MGYIVIEFDDKDAMELFIEDYKVCLKDLGHPDPIEISSPKARYALAFEHCDQLKLFIRELVGFIPSISHRCTISEYKTDNPIDAFNQILLSQGPIPDPLR